MLISALNNNISFTSGKVHLYSDFDGTYCPVKHRDLHDFEKTKLMTGYAKKMQNFFEAHKSYLDFHITTGRTFGEYEAISWLIKMGGHQLPLPDSFIAKNGSDEYIKTGLDSDFYEKNIFPFSYSKPNTLKENAIKAETNWDGQKLKEFIKNLAQKYKLKFIEADSENSVNDYGDKSLFSSGKLNPDEWKRLPTKDGKFLEHNNPVADFIMGSRNDGNLKINLTFSPDYGHCPVRNYIYDGFMGEIKKYINDNKISANFEWILPESKNHFRHSCSILPKVNNESLTKLYDTKLAVQNAIKTNDLVILAGDGSNDFKMLNPLEYLDKEFLKTCENNSNNKSFYKADMKNKLEMLKKVLNNDLSEEIVSLRNELQNNNFIKTLKELPLVSIVINKDKSPLAQLVETFSSIGKIISVEQGDLDKGIKAAIEKYSSQNKFFNNAINSTSKSSNTIKILVTSALVTAGAILGYSQYSAYKVASNANTIFKN